MTDNEIIKALECCITDEPCRKTKCPFYKNNTCANDIRALERLALDLINRLQAENERLKCYESITSHDLPVIPPLKISKPKDEIAEIKAEAYKEFFDLVHSEFKTISDYQYGKLNMTFCSNFQVAIDKLREIYRKLEGGTSV